MSLSRFRTEIIGDATLILGDCREVLDSLQGPVQGVITSPPYGDIRDYGGHSREGLLDVITQLAYRVADGGVIVWNVADQVVNGSESGESFRHALHAISIGLRLHDTMIYCKEGVTFPDSNRYHPAFEYMFVFSNGAPLHFNGIRDWTNKWRGTSPHGTKRVSSGETVSTKSIGFGEPESIPENGLRRNWWPVNSGGNRGVNAAHPAPMPFSIAFDHIATWTARHETILDPFMGSGTTGVACMNLGRRFTGIEIHEPYFDIACRRIEQAWKQPRLFEEPAPKPVQESLL